MKVVVWVFNHRSRKEHTMGIDSRIDVTIRIATTTPEAKSLPNTLIGLTGGPGMVGDGMTITYPIYDGRCRALHGGIMDLASSYGLIDQDDLGECAGEVDLFRRGYTRATDAQRGGAILNGLYDWAMYIDDIDHLPHLIEAIRALTRLPFSIERVTYHWC
jgi:hypothetical protein